MSFASQVGAHSSVEGNRYSLPVYVP